MRSSLDFVLWACVTMGYSTWSLHITSPKLHISLRYNGLTEESYAFRQWVQTCMYEFAEWGFCQALPHPLRKGGFFYTSSSATREQTLNNTLWKSKVHHSNNKVVELNVALNKLETMTTNIIETVLIQITAVFWDMTSAVLRWTQIFQRLHATSHWRQQSPQKC